MGRKQRRRPGRCTGQDHHWMSEGGEGQSGLEGTGVGERKKKMEKP